MRYRISITSIQWKKLHWTQLASVFRNSFIVSPLNSSQMQYTTGISFIHWNNTVANAFCKQLVRNSLTTSFLNTSLHALWKNINLFNERILCWISLSNTFLGTFLLCLLNNHDMHYRMSITSMNWKTNCACGATCKWLVITIFTSSIVNNSVYALQNDYHFQSRKEHCIKHILQLTC